MLTEQQKGAISRLFVGAMSALEADVLTREEFDGLVDKVAERLPGGPRQQDFYSAFRELANKVK